MTGLDSTTSPWINPAHQFSTVQTHKTLYFTAKHPPHSPSANCPVQPDSYAEVMALRKASAYLPLIGQTAGSRHQRTEQVIALRPGCGFPPWRTVGQITSRLVRQAMNRQGEWAEGQLPNIFLNQ